MAVFICICIGSRSLLRVLARPGRVRRVRNTVARTELGPRHTRPATAVVARRADQAHAGLLRHGIPIGVHDLSLVKAHAPRALLARVHEPAAAKVRATGPVGAGLRGVQLRGVQRLVIPIEVPGARLR